MDTLAGFGQRLRDARNAAGLTLVQFAEKIDTSFQAVARFETGACLPSVPVLCRIADALSTSTDALLGRQSGRRKG